LVCKRKRPPYVGNEMSPLKQSRLVRGKQARPRSPFDDEDEHQILENKFKYRVEYLPRQIES